MGSMIATSEGLYKYVKLWNRGKNTFDREVNGSRLVIQPGEFKKMPRRDAINARGIYLGKDVEVSLIIEPIMDEGRDMEKVEVPEPEKCYACPKCDKEFMSKEDYQKHYDDKHKRVRGVPAQRTADLQPVGQKDDAK